MSEQENGARQGTASRGATPPGAKLDAKRQAALKGALSQIEKQFGKGTVMRMGDPGERVPGEKKVIGPRAQRFYEEKKARGEIPVPPIPEGVNCDVDGAPVPASAAPKPSDLLIGVAALAPAAVAAAWKVRNEFKKIA